MKSNTKSEFDTWKFARDLPPVLVLNLDHHFLAYGAEPGFEIDKVIVDDRILMLQVFYTTPDRIHGLLHYEGPTQMHFMGYKCGVCSEVFLVPVEVTDMYSLAQAMRHGCTARLADRSAYEAKNRVDR